MIRILSAAVLAISVAHAALAADDTPAAGSSPASSSSSPDTAATSAPGSPSSPAKMSSPANGDKAVADGFIYKPKPTDVVTGKDDVPVVIVEYASLSCPHCSHFYIHAMPDLTTKYFDTGKAKLVYRDYPINPPALKAAELVQCADPDRRHAYIKVLFNTQLKWAYDTNYRDALGNIAVLGGMDRLKFEHCMEDKSVAKAIGSVANEAQQQYHVNSTPTFFINGVHYTDNYDAPSMGKAIDAALAKATQK